MPPRTRSARIATPVLGAPVWGGGQRVARLTGASIRRDGRGFFALFTAIGANAACAGPLSLANGWSGYVDYYIPVRRSVVPRVQVECGRNGRVRPQAIVVNCTRNRAALTLRRLRWRRWGGRTARGQGTYVGNDCKPTCAKGTHRAYPVRLELSRATQCGSLWLYGRLTMTFPSRLPRANADTRRYSIPISICG